MSSGEMSKREEEQDTQGLARKMARLAPEAAHDTTAATSNTNSNSNNNGNYHINNSGATNSDVADGKYSSGVVAARHPNPSPSSSSAAAKPIPTPNPAIAAAGQRAAQPYLGAPNRRAQAAPSAAQVQSYLDENQLILKAIQENLTRGNLRAVTLYQQKLQENLVFLATLADEHVRR